MMAGSLARRYARALIQIATEEKHVEKFGQDLESLLKSLEGTQEGETRLLHALADDLIDPNQRIAAIAAVADQAQFHPMLKNFLSLLVKKERIVFLPDIVREYVRYQDEMTGTVRVIVQAPTLPESSVLQRVEKILANKLKKTVLSRGEKNTDMLGGLILKIGYVIYDGSLRHQLEEIKENILSA